jgi:hypothetical protein
MNRSKGAAVLMLVGAFVAGGGATYAATTLSGARSASEPECPTPRADDKSYRERFYERFGIVGEQREQFELLLDGRNKAVSEVIAIPRAKSDSVLAAARAISDSILAGPRARADSIRSATLQKQEALFTPEQRAMLADQRAVMEQRRSERQAQQARCAAQSKDAQPRSQSSKNKSNN